MQAPAVDVKEARKNQSKPGKRARRRQALKQRQDAAKEAAVAQRTAFNTSSVEPLLPRVDSASSGSASPEPKAESCIEISPTVSNNFTDFKEHFPPLSTTEAAVWNDILKRLQVMESATSESSASKTPEARDYLMLIKETLTSFLGLIAATGYGAMTYDVMSNPSEQKEEPNALWMTIGLFFATASFICNFAQARYALDLEKFYKDLSKKIPGADKYPVITAGGLITLSAALAYWGVFPTLPLTESLPNPLSSCPLTRWMDAAPMVKAWFIYLMSGVRDTLFMKSMLNFPFSVYEYLKDAWVNWTTNDNKMDAAFNISALALGSYIATVYSLGQIPKAESAAPQIGADPTAAGWAALPVLLALNTLFVGKGIKALEKIDTIAGALSACTALLTGASGVALLHNASVGEKIISYAAATLSNFASLVTLEMVADKVQTAKVLKSIALLKEELNHLKDYPVDSEAGEKALNPGIYANLLEKITALETSIMKKSHPLEPSASTNSLTWGEWWKAKLGCRSRVVLVVSWATV